jgi:hypothetical protein
MDYTWQKSSPCFSQALAFGYKVSYQSHGQQHSEQETELVFMSPGKQLPGGKKQENIAQNLSLH